MAVQVKKEALSRTVPSEGPSPVPSLPLYHLFRKYGERFVCDCAAGRFFHIDNAAYDYLTLLLRMPTTEARAEMVSTLGYPNSTVDEVGGQTARLFPEGGAFRPQCLTPEKIDRLIAKRHKAPWTTLELALAETCNLACKYCYCETCRDMPRKGLMSRETAQKAIDWLFEVSGNAKNLALTLFGGEPLLNKEVFQFAIDYSSELGRKAGKTVRYSMTTNGTLLDDMVIGYIKRYNFGLMVSLDGPPDIHNAQCPFHDGSGSFDAAAAGIKRLMARRKQVTVRCTITNQRPRLLDLIRFFEDFGFTRIALGLAKNPVGDSGVDCDEATIAEYDRQQEEEVFPWILQELESGRIPKYFPYSQALREQAARSQPATRANGSKGLRCGACHGTATVGADGAMYPCHRFVRMTQFVIGGIGNPPAEDRVRRFWNDYYAQVNPQCTECWAAAICRAPCPWDLALSDGTLSLREPSECPRALQFLERTAWLHWWLQTKHPTTYDRIVGSPKGEDREMPAVQT